MTITIVTLLAFLYQTQGNTQSRPRTNNSNNYCIQRINESLRSSGSRKARLTTKWNNGNTYVENVFFSGGSGGYYLNWENSQDKFLVNINGNKFQLTRGQNWQTYNGVCTNKYGWTSDGLSVSRYVIEGNAYSYPDQVSGTFNLDL
ncbi:MAG: hypothetical protein ACK5VD_00985 [Aphanizomenon sp.]|jgi:hypothetical protein